jgi:hypothetical protein
MKHMSLLEARLDEMYNEFRTISAPRFVRNNRGDAFALLTFEILFREHHSIRKIDAEQHLELLKKSLVIAPDDGIDIVFQQEVMGDEPKFHIVQCKDAVLAQEDIRECFLKMRDSVTSYVENRDCKKNLKRVLFENDFSRESLNSCLYYVVHAGETDRIPRQKDNEQIITRRTLEELGHLLVKEAVPYEVFESDALNNFIVNNFVDRADAEIDPNVPKSILCNLSGYDLACLDKKYSKSTLGRNILYGR